MCTDADASSPRSGLITAADGQAQPMFPAAILAGAIGTLFWIITVLVILAIVGVITIIKKVL